MVTHLIGEKEPRRKAAFFQQLYLSVFDSTLPLYQHQYPGFGDRDLMTLKTLWDYSFYWSVLAYLFFTDKLTDMAFLGNVQPPMAKARALNRSMQEKFRAVGALRRQLPADGRFIDHYAVGMLSDLKRQLIADNTGHEQARLEANVGMLEELATVLAAELQRCVDGGRLGRIERIRGLEAAGRHLLPASRE